MVRVIVVATAASDSAVAAKYSGHRDPGDEAPLVTCNTKVIGAQYVNQGIGGSDGLSAVVDGQNLATIDGRSGWPRQTKH